MCRNRPPMSTLVLAYRWPRYRPAPTVYCVPALLWEVRSNIFGSGDITGLDKNGTPHRELFQSLCRLQSFGWESRWRSAFIRVTGKLINATLAGRFGQCVSRRSGKFLSSLGKSAIGGDADEYRKPTHLLERGGPAPHGLSFGRRLPTRSPMESGVGRVYARTGQASMRMGAEWNPAPAFSGRVGYRTDTLSGLSPIAGLTVGMGLHF